jgi:hypothetical protein
VTLTAPVLSRLTLNVISGPALSLWRFRRSYL